MGRKATWTRKLARTWFKSRYLIHIPALHWIYLNHVCANVAVWDLFQLRQAWKSVLPCEHDFVSDNALYQNMHFRSSFHRGIFDETDVAFEHIFSVVGYLSGLNVGFLPAIMFRHVGSVSAYSLNNFTRPWEGNSNSIHN